MQSIISEYTMMKKLSECDNIVKCDDIRSVQHDNGIGWDVYIKMEFLTPLVDALPDIITEDATIKLAKDICNALVVCDKNNVLHRDIKPQNIFVATNGCYKLGDFGISKIAQKTSYGTHVGTPKYMAPEVYNNQPYGVSADIYSLGLVMYWMLNQRRMPFLPATGKISMAMDEQAKARRLSGERIPAPANGSNSLKKVVLKACAYNPEERYKTPQQMLVDLNNLGKKSEPKPILDLYKTVQLTEQEAKFGCTKTVQGENGKIYSVKVPANAKNGDILRLMGAGKTDPVTGIKGIMYVTLNILNPAPKPPEPDNQPETKTNVVMGEVYDKKRYKNEDWSDVPDAQLLAYINKTNHIFLQGCIIPLLVFVGSCALAAYTMMIPIGVIGLIGAGFIAFSPDHIEKNREAAKKEWNKRHPDNKK